MMDRAHVQAQLVSVYRRWKSAFDPAGLNISDFSSPVLLFVREEYCRASTKILVYGQETKEWGWSGQQQEESHQSRSGWPFQDHYTLRHFLENDDAIDALIWIDERFDFARGPLGPRP